jgi:hypothetical protein
MLHERSLSLLILKEEKVVDPIKKKLKYIQKVKNETNKWYGHFKWPHKTVS